MESQDLTALVAELLEDARGASSMRSGRTIHGGREHHLRQTVLALAAGGELADHESPGEATLQVLAGRVRLSAAEESWEGGPGDYLVIPPHRHRVDALEDAAIMLTVVVATREG